jgi:hypothetical protein
MTIYDKTAAQVPSVPSTPAAAPQLTTRRLSLHCIIIEVTALESMRLVENAKNCLPMNLGKRVCVIQSNYIPWRGFFALIGCCDEYVVFDGAQFTKRHWHNRNLIKTKDGPLWLTIPVLTKGRFMQSIHDTQIEKQWTRKHWRTIEAAYAKASFFRDVAPILHRIYESVADESSLAKVNLAFLEGLSRILDLPTNITCDMDYAARGRKTERLLGICQSAHASVYLNGPSAKTYFDEAVFRQNDIAVEWMNYDQLRPYPQLHGGFLPRVSVVDLLFNVGPDRAKLYLSAGPSSGSIESHTHGTISKDEPDCTCVQFSRNA